MTAFTIELPDRLALDFGETAAARSRRVLECFAIHEYRCGRLSHRQVGEVLGMDRWQTDSFLCERKVPLNYSIEDLEADRATLARIMGEPTIP